MLREFFEQKSINLKNKNMQKNTPTTANRLLKSNPKTGKTLPLFLKKQSFLKCLLFIWSVSLSTTIVAQNKTNACCKHDNYSNTASGHGALYSGNSTVGHSSTAVGFKALHLNKYGTFNSAVGHSALYTNGTGSYNAALGAHALYFNETGNNNTAIGYAALKFNTKGTNNAALGHAALYYNKEGSSNNAVGMYALFNNLTGNDNAAFGNSVLYNNTKGGYNSAFGNTALYFNNTGNNNTAIGYAALHHNTDGSYNSAFGNAALNANETGILNAAFGNSALLNNTKGSYNSAFGNDALHHNKTGNNNIAIGCQSGFNNISGSTNLFMGHQAGYNELGSNKLYIANNQSSTLIYGEFDNKGVGINTTVLGGFTLAVEGVIGTRGIEVTANAWSDFVFNEDYTLRPLEEVAQFIKKNKHLPEVPSESEVLKNGIDLVKMDATLLQKIEELTLYMIELNKENKALKKEIDILKGEK